MGRINTILFDFDGTVMNTNDVIIQSWQHTFRAYEGKERPVEQIIQTFGEPLITTMAKVLPDIPLEEAVDVYRSYHRDNFSEMISVFPGVIELLDELKTRGYKMAVVTSRLYPTTMQGIEKHNLGGYFDCIVTADDTDKHKPDPEPVNIALGKLSARPEDALMVGDSMFDILCAKNAGIKSVLVSWAMAVTEEEKKGPDAPDFYIEKAMDLLEILEAER